MPASVRKVFFRAALAILAALSPVLLECHSLDSILMTITEGPAEKVMTRYHTPSHVAPRSATQRRTLGTLSPFVMISHVRKLCAATPSPSLRPRPPSPPLDREGERHTTAARAAVQGAPV